MASTPVQVVIDGMPFAGKSTLASHLSQKFQLQWLHLHSLLSGIAAISLKANVGLADHQALLSLLQTHQFELKPPFPGLTYQFPQVFINQRNYTYQLQSPSIISLSLNLANHPVIRSWLPQYLEPFTTIACILDGSNLSPLLLSQAKLSLYLTASTPERLERMLASKSSTYTLSHQRSRLALHQLDQNHTSNNHHSLLSRPQTWILDTTSLAIDQVTSIVSSHL